MQMIRKKLKDRIPEKPFEVDDCWLDRDGQTYVCEWGYHTALAREICDAAGMKPHAHEKVWTGKIWDGEKRLEQRGWTKISQGKPYSIRITEARYEFRKLSRAQFDFCLEYLSTRIRVEGDPPTKRKYRAWLEELIEDEP